MAQYLWRFPFSGTPGERFAAVRHPRIPPPASIPGQDTPCVRGAETAENFLPIPAQIRGLAEGSSWRRQREYFANVASSTGRRSKWSCHRITNSGRGDSTGRGPEQCPRPEGILNWSSPMEAAVRIAVTRLAAAVSISSQSARIHRRHELSKGDRRHWPRFCALPRQTSGSMSRPSIVEW